ncbi:MAG: hypothetical protein CMH62_03660 [Nanoarchaeota archaeon]|nr:hypothetical protein [Nanoarchaeota archaeon]
MKLERILRNTLIGSLIAGSTIFGCGKKENPIIPENKAPETELSALIVSDDTKEVEIGDETVEYNVYFYVHGTDEDGSVNNFDFRIEGSETYSDWTNTGSNDNFINLPEGDYVLHTRSIDNEDAVDPTPITRNFTVSPSDIITIPIETEESTNVFEGTTENGLVSFIDSTSEDNQAAITILDQTTNLPLEAEMVVTYYDDPEFKVFRASDPNEQFLPTMGLFEHNSPHTLVTRPVKDGFVHIQTLEEEEIRVLQRWEIQNQNLGWWTTHEYLTTIDDTERLELKEKNLAIVRLVDTSYNLVGVSLPISFETLADYFDPFRDKAKAKRWDVYEFKHGTRFRDSTGDVELVPSNIPVIDLTSVEVIGNEVTVLWDSSDKTTYDIPFNLPAKDDLTVLLGPTENSDLQYTIIVTNNREEIEGEDYFNGATAISSPIHNLRGWEFNFIPDGSYTVFADVTDEVGNTSRSDTLEFIVGEEPQVEEIPIEPIFFENTIEILETYIHEDLKSYPQTEGLTYDGENFWFIEGTHTIHKTTKEFTTLRTYDPITPGGISDLAWHNNNLYASNGNEIYRFDDSLNVIETTWMNWHRFEIQELESAGDRLWMQFDDELIELGENMEINNSYTTDTIEKKMGFRGFAYDGTDFWMAFKPQKVRQSPPVLYRLSKEDFSIKEKYELPSQIGHITGLAYENGNFWVLGGKKLTKLRIND